MAKYEIKRDGNIAIIAIDDGKMNALTLEQFDSLGACLTQVEHSDAEAVVLTGREGCFTAGLNLKVLPTLDTPELLKVLTRFGEVVGHQLALFPKPVVAAITGHAIAAGTMMAFASDVRIFAKGPYKFGLNEVPGGLPVPAFGVELARAVVNPQYLTSMVMHGLVIDPDGALARGIADAVLPMAEVMPAALDRARQLAQLPFESYSITKRKLRGAAADLARASLSSEMQILGRSLGAKA